MTQLLLGRKRGSGALARNTGLMILGQSTRLLVQAGCFFAVARSLGPEQYGAFVAVTAAVAIAYPFVGNGSGILMIKHVARDPSCLPHSLASALSMTAITGALLNLLVAPACLLLLPPAIPVTVVVAVVMSDLLVFRFVDVVCWAFQAVERLGWTATLNVVASLSRLAAITGLVATKRVTLVAWSGGYLAASFFSALVAVGCMLWKLPRPRFNGCYFGELREGFWFSTSLSAQTIYNDIDKAMLARLATLDAAGLYAAAYRVIDVAFMPVRSLLAATYPGFFRHGKRGLCESLAYGRRILLKPLLYSVLVALGILLAAPLVPHVLGANYLTSTVALRWLALLPLLKTLHHFGADSLAGAGHQGLRMLMQILVAAFNVLANLWVIPAHSWRGAAWTSLASDALLAILLWTCAGILQKRSFPALNPGVIVS